MNELKITITVTDSEGVSDKYFEGIDSDVFEEAVEFIQAMKEKFLEAEALKSDAVEDVLEK